MAGVGELERDAAGARADVEDALGRLAGELAPERQVGVVAAALDVVPDHVVGAHRQYASAWPRRVSSSRSSSSAV